MKIREAWKLYSKRQRLVRNMKRVVPVLKEPENKNWDSPPGFTVGCPAYFPIQDIIRVPRVNRWNLTKKWILIHELFHATGHWKRLHRIFRVHCKTSPVGFLPGRDIPNLDELAADYAAYLLLDRSPIILAHINAYALLYKRPLSVELWFSKQPLMEKVEALAQEGIEYMKRNGWITEDGICPFYE